MPTTEQGMNQMQHPNTRNQRKHRKQLVSICGTYARREIKKAFTGLKNMDTLNILVLEKRLASVVNKVMGQVTNLIYEGVENTIINTRRHYEGRVYQNNHQTIPDHVSRGIQSEIYRQFMDSGFRGKTIAQRIRIIDKKLRKNIQDRINLAYTEGPRNKRELIKDLNDLFLSEASVRGGTLWGRADTLLVSEENRFYHETAIAILKAANVPYLRFTLTKEHTTNDICDKLSKYVDPVLEYRLKEMGISAKGVYRTPEFPDYPHPRALYYIEPIFIT